MYHNKITLHDFVRYIIICVRKIAMTMILELRVGCQYALVSRTKQDSNGPTFYFTLTMFINQRCGLLRLGLCLGWK